MYFSLKYLKKTVLLLQQLLQLSHLISSVLYAQVSQVLEI